jgi:hypothetical protein
MKGTVVRIKLAVAWAFSVVFFLTGMIAADTGSKSAQLSAEACVQIERNSQPANHANIDEAFVRVEPWVDASTAAGLQGSVRVRIQSLTGQSSPSPNTSIALREAWASIPIAELTLRAGRWQEAYTPMVIFGRYLYGVAPAAIVNGDSMGRGSGALEDKPWTVLDGVRLDVPLVKRLNTSMSVALLPSKLDFSDVYFCALVSSQPFEFLDLHLGADLQVVTPGDTTPKHRAAASASYEMISGFKLTAEYGITDLERVGDESWIAAGLVIPTAGILDLLKAEIEYNKDRLGPGTSGDLAVAMLARKTFSKVQLDLLGGSDPHYFGSQRLRHVGLALRASVQF